MSVKRISIVLLATILITAFGTVAIKDAARTKDNLKFQDVEIRTRQTELEEWNEKYNQLNQNLNKATEQKGQNEEEVKKLQTEKEELEKQKKDLEAQLQAKIENKRRLAEASSRVVNAATATGTAHASSYGTGTIQNMIREGARKHGLSEEQMLRVANCESTFNPNAVNKNYYAGGGNPSGIS